MDRWDQCEQVWAGVGRCRISGGQVWAECGWVCAGSVWAGVG